MFHTISESLNQNVTVNGVIYLIFSHSLNFMQNKFCGEFKLRQTSLRVSGLSLPRDQGLSEVLQEIIQDDVGVDARVVRGVGEQVRHHCLSHLIVTVFLYMAATYPYSIKNQRKARNVPSRGLWVP